MEGSGFRLLAFGLGSRVMGLWASGWYKNVREGMRRQDKQPHFEHPPQRVPGVQPPLV